MNLSMTKHHLADGVGKPRKRDELLTEKQPPCSFDGCTAPASGVVTRESVVWQPCAPARSCEVFLGQAQDVLWEHVAMSIDGPLVP